MNMVPYLSVLSTRFVLGWYEGLTVSCGTCVDGIDNNCDGRVDQDDPACSQCFVGWGFSCACESGSGGPPPGSVWFVVAALVGLRRRRE